MHGQKGDLKDRFITKRIVKANIRKKKSDFQEFDKLLEFNTNKKVNVFLEYKENKDITENERMVLLRANFLDDKDENNQKKLKVTNEDKSLDFSMFDDLLKAFDDNLTIKEEAPKKYSFKSLEENLDYLKQELKYYENKIENEYKLDNVEKEEKELFDLKVRIDELKTKIVNLKGNLLDNINDYKFSGMEDENLINLYNYCKEELKKLEKILHHENKEIDTNEINSKINKNIKLQKEFIDEMESKLETLDEQLKGKLHLLMLKRMIYNLFKMTVGVYMAEVSKNKNMKLMVGSFLIINSTLGIKEAIGLKSKKEKYYKYRDYTNSVLTKKENLILAYDILNKALENIESLEKEFKNSFCDYKPWIHDYEEIYFKLDKLKEIIDSKQREISNLTLNTIKTKELKQYA